MPLKRVPFLKPGRYRLADGRVVEHTAAGVRAICGQGNRQLAAGLRVPLSWMHDPAALPQYLSHLPAGKPAPHADAWLARHWFGEVKRFEVEPGGGGVAVCDIPDETDAIKFERVGQVSPGIYQNWTDEREVLWPGFSVCHLASTPRPINRANGRITPYLPQFLSHPVRATDVQLFSFPAHRSAPMADEMEPTDGAMDLSEVIDLLKKLDIHGMDGVADMPTLVAALKAAVHTKLGDAGDADAAGEPDGDEMAGTDPAQPPAFMSHPVVKAVLAENAALRRDKLVAEANALLAETRITKEQHKELVDELTAQHMSHPLPRPDGTRRKSEVEIKLAAYAKNPKSKLAAPQFHSAPAGTAAVPHPDADKKPAGVADKALARAAVLGVPLRGK